MTRADDDALLALYELLYFLRPPNWDPAARRDTAADVKLLTRIEQDCVARMSQLVVHGSVLAGPAHQCRLCAT